jgi:hypothetical protein
MAHCRHNSTAKIASTNTPEVTAQLTAYLLTVDIAVWQNPWWVLCVHELLGDVADEL